MSHVRDIERLLRETMGLDAQTLGAQAIERAVRARLAVLPPEMHDAPAYSQYWQWLQQSPQELQALIEAVVVPETWFFRHREAFTVLAQMARDERAARRGTVREGQPLRLLSLPCATGEEPYSMAMAMFDTGFGASDFTVDALDISERGLALAREGRYGRNSFRGPPGSLSFRERYFTPDDDGYRVIEALRTQVRWHAGNLFDAALVDRLGTFDFVFFRNVLIYFDRDGQRRAIAALERLMRMGATLFAGPAEGGTLTSNGLTSTGHVQAFAFRVAGPVRDVVPVPTGVSRIAGTLASLNATPPASSIDAVAQRRNEGKAAVHAGLTRPTVAPFATSNVVATPPAVPRAVTVATAATAATAATVASADVDAQLEQARGAADAGDFVRAVALCRSVLATDRANAQAEYLLGLVEDARGDAQGALVHYRRALYLDPGHYEALVHCAAQLDARGDAAGARRLLERAERAEQAERVERADPTRRKAATSSASPDHVHRHGTRHR
ncbi:CheR-type MCP methyltransferase [Pandoraea eparura]|uniref:CheR-type MCP methyltransferase n=1 Tax=Pandoraea eparura TaxID=2508291 RepID=A0A5E4TRI6_9BURK|nr:protein-glutamate O-methyltransferase CheR [Pandoraea eparura]VVD90191.1 CheR-type MCP methyltransferase [Pandoraea eparura]